MPTASEQNQRHTGSDVSTSKRIAAQTRRNTGTKRGSRESASSDASKASASKTGSSTRNNKVTVAARKSTTTKAALARVTSVASPAVETVNTTTDDVGVAFSISIPITLGAQPQFLKLPY